MAKTAEEKSAAKAARDAAKLAKKAAKMELKEAQAAGVTLGEGESLSALDRMAALRSVTGVLASREAAQDIKVPPPPQCCRDAASGQTGAPTGQRMRGHPIRSISRALTNLAIQNAEA